MSRKTENEKSAKKWLSALESDKTMRQAINKCVAMQTVYRGQLYTRKDEAFVKTEVNGKVAHVQITSETTHDAIVRLHDEGAYLCCALNFASYFNPGGGFSNGSFAQEESLCQVSPLYKILGACDAYKIRREDKTVPSWYYDEVIYTPGVPFVREKFVLGMPINCDVISIAAPNCNRVPASKIKEIELAIDKRLTACYIIPYLNGADTLILGAWGCGVFKNDPVVIASTFCTLNYELGGLYNKIVFAIPNDKLRKTFEGTFQN